MVLLRKVGDKAGHESFGSRNMTFFYVS